MNPQPRIAFSDHFGATQAALARKQALASRVENLLTPSPSRQPSFEPPTLPVNSLLASAVAGELDLFSTEHLGAQKRRALVAAVNAVPVALADEEPVEVRLLAAVTAWLDGTDHSAKAWRAMLRGVLLRDLDAETRRHGKQLARIFKPSEQDRIKAIQSALEATEDLRERLLAAEDDRDQSNEANPSSSSRSSSFSSLTAAGKWGLKSLLTAAHQKLVAASVLQHAVATYEHITFKQRRMESGFTGRRRFVAGDTSPNGRHVALHHKIDATGEGWELPEREIGGKVLPARRVLFPGDDPQSPGEWSNTRSKIQYEHKSRTGKITWHSA